MKGSGKEVKEIYHRNKYTEEIKKVTQTYFAPPETTTDKELVAEIEIVANNPLVSGLLHSINGLLAVVDEHRQVVAANESLLQMLNIAKPAEVLGLRPGKILNCIHSEEEPAGCGTTKFCTTCGVAIAMVSSLDQNKPVERTCALSAKRGNKNVDVVLLVKSHPINIEQKRFLLLFLQDITLQHQRAALERTFFHDINNMVSVLLGGTELLTENNPSGLIRDIHSASRRIQKEVEIQRCLSQNHASSYQPIRYEVTTEQIITELKSFFSTHPVTKTKNIIFQENAPSISIATDISLLSRVLCNMTINALEATKENGIVKLWFELKDGLLIVNVWNAQEIPEEIAIRIFQRNFSTKKQDGRGVGTFSMKLFGETYLGGKVDFTTSPEEGTIFRFSHPL